MKNYFNFQEASNGWIICPNWNEFCEESKQIEGSFALIACRLSGLSWPQWLRYCKQNGAILYGKGNRYVVAIWKEKNQSFLKELNMRANEIAKYINLKELDL